MLEPFLFAILFNLAMFIPAFMLRTDKLTDISYALTFLIMAGYYLLKHTDNLNAVYIILFIMICLWSVRLGSYLLFRIHKMGRDKRFDDMRHYFLKFLRFWLLQGLTVFIILLPSLYVFTSHPRYFVGASIFGIILFIFGLMYETIADLQKYSFLKNKHSTTKFMHTGLWKYSRHPNYFGEICVWLGIYLFCIFYLELKFALISAISPVFIFILLRYVSGIPLLERSAQKKYGDKPEYKRYLAQTPRLFPRLIKAKKWST